MRVYSKMSAIMPNVFNKRAMRKLMLMCFLSPSSQDLLESLSLSLIYSVFTE
jgi:membrane protein CcdC involved in cytochrome C biogenesis